jgi:hypothetical protein
MKTNQVMSVLIGTDEIEVEHKTMMGNLLDVVKAGGKIRAMEGKTPFNLSQFMKKKSTNEYINHLITDEGIPTPYEVRGKRSQAKTMGHLYLMVYVAQHISDRFATKVIKVFVNDQILKLRDDGGNDFKTLNKAIDTMGDRIKGKRNNGLYIQVSKRLRDKIFGEYATEFDESKKSGELPKSANIWNQEIATAQKHEERTDIESNLIKFIEMGFIDSKEELYSAIEKL